MSFENFPYSNFHDMNLDWIINQWLDMKKSFATYEEAFKDLKNFVDGYFTNLDVQKEINNKLDSMASSGELATLISTTINTMQPIIVNATSEMKDKSTIYILANTGVAYQWNGSSFVATSLQFNSPINSYNSHSHTSPLNIENVNDIGTFTINSESLTGLIDEKPDGYYWTCACIKPIVSDDTDNMQILFGVANYFTENLYPVIYIRYSLYNSYTKFKKITYDTDKLYTYSLENIDIDTVKVGSFRVNTESLSAYKDELGINISEYYFSVMQFFPSTANDVDCLQMLFATPISPNNGDSIIFIRSSISSPELSFRKFARINNLSYTRNFQKVCFCGDSFTAVTSVPSYVNYLNDNGVCNGINLGISGSTPKTWFNVHEKDIDDSYDTFFIAFGLNGLSDPNGEYNSIDSSTFCGQMNILINKINEVNPTARIIIWCMDAWFPQERAEALQKLANYQGCEYFSMLGDSSIPIRINGKYTNVMPNLSESIVSLKNNAFKLSDDHPNEKAQKLLANYLKTIL